MVRVRETLLLLRPRFQAEKIAKRVARMLECPAPWFMNLDKQVTLLVNCVGGIQLKHQSEVSDCGLHD